MATVSTPGGKTPEVGSYPRNPELGEDCWNDSLPGRSEERQCTDERRLQPPGVARGLLGDMPGPPIGLSATGTTPATGTTTWGSGLPGRSAESGAPP